MQRCPTCGRAWDGQSCFACGHDAHANAAASKGAASRGTGTTASSAGPANRSAVPGPTASVPDLTDLLAMAASIDIDGGDGQGAVAGAAMTGDLHSQPTLTMARPEHAGSAAADADANDVVLSGEPAFLRRLPAPVRRLWRHSAIFVVAFVLGFVGSFVVGAAVLWRGPTPERLLEEGRADQLLATLPEKDLTPTQALWRGHALRLKEQREAMLAAYAIAVAGGVGDARALDNTVEALGFARSRKGAVQLLVGWPSDRLDERLSTVAGDGNHERRHGAVEVLNARPQASDERRLRAAVLAAVADVQSDVCDEKASGVAALAALVQIPRAAGPLRDLQAWKAVYEQNTGRVFDQCRSLDAAGVKKTETALGANERR
jgi:hypothetical protein